MLTAYVAGMSAVSAQEVELCSSLHTLGDYGQPQSVSHGDDGGGEGAVIGVVWDLGDEGAVDLDAV